MDLPEFKGKHRKFRNLVSSYLGKCSVQKNSSVMKFSTHLFRTYFFSKSIKKYFRFRLAFMVSVPRFVAQCTSHVIFFFFVSFAVRWNPNIQLKFLHFVLDRVRVMNMPISTTFHFFFTSMCQLLIIFYVTLSTSIRFLIFFPPSFRFLVSDFFFKYCI